MKNEELRITLRGVLETRNSNNPTLRNHVA